MESTVARLRFWDAFKGEGEGGREGGRGNQVAGRSKQQCSQVELSFYGDRRGISPSVSGNRGEMTVINTHKTPIETE